MVDESARNYPRYTEEGRRMRRQAVEISLALGTDFHRVQSALAHLDETSAGMAGDISRLIAVTDARLSELVRGVAATNGYLASLVSMVGRPSATKASELRERAIKALTSDWIEEAARDFQAAVNENPYDYVAYFGLGESHARLDNYEEAFKAFSGAVRYAAPDAPALAAGAALLGASAATSAGLDDEAGKLLQHARDSLPTCPDVSLASAIRSHEDASLVEALRANPRLVLEAKAVGLGVDAAARDAVVVWGRRVDTLQSATAAATAALGSEGDTRVLAALAAASDAAGAPARGAVRVNDSAGRLLREFVAWSEAREALGRARRTVQTIIETPMTQSPRQFSAGSPPERTRRERGCVLGLAASGAGLVVFALALIVDARGGNANGVGIPLVLVAMLVAGVAGGYGLNGTASGPGFRERRKLHAADVKLQAHSAREVAAWNATNEVAASTTQRALSCAHAIDAGLSRSEARRFVTPTFAISAQDVT
jgi:tetratricopeptide (TPR) repeat protein